MQRKSLVRLANGCFATLKYLFLADHAGDAELRQPSKQYRDARAAFLKLPREGEADQPPAKRQRSAPPSEGKLVLPAMPVLLALVEAHEYVDKQSDPFRISYPGGKEEWITIEAITTQAALALHSEDKREATACPPHDLYVWKLLPLSSSLSLLVRACACARVCWLLRNSFVLVVC